MNRLRDSICYRVRFHWEGNAYAIILAARNVSEIRTKLLEMYGNIPPDVTADKLHPCAKHHNQGSSGQWEGLNRDLSLYT